MTPGRTVYVLTKEHCGGSYGDGPCFTVIGVFVDRAAAAEVMRQLAVDTGADARWRAGQWVVDRARMAERPGVSAADARAFRAQIDNAVQAHGLPPDATAAQIAAHLDSAATRARFREEATTHVVAYPDGAYGYAITEEVVQ